MIFHKKVGEMLYSHLNRNVITISKAKKLLEKVETRLQQKRYNYIALHMNNESFKDLIMKFEVNLEDKVAFEALLHSSHTKV